MGITTATRVPESETLVAVQRAMLLARERASLSDGSEEIPGQISMLPFWWPFGFFLASNVEEHEVRLSSGNPNYQN